MKDYTDLKRVKSVARMLMRTDVHKTELSPMIVQHPFTSTGLVMLPTEPHQLLDITKTIGNLKMWQYQMIEEINKAEKIMDIYAMVNKPYCLTFLKFAMPYLSTEDFSKLLADVWIRSENPNMDANVNKQKLITMFGKAEAKYLMSEQERRQLNALDDEVTVYRGVTTFNAKNIKALSWTLNLKKAKWFANRFDEDGTVYEARIKKENIFAVFNGRNEAEIIVNPNKLEDIHEVWDLSLGMDIIQN